MVPRGAFMSKLFFQPYRLELDSREVAAEKEMITPFFGCSSRSSAPMFIAEGQNILDAVLPPTSSTAADLFSNIPIDPHFDFAVDVFEF